MLPSPSGSSGEETKTSGGAGGDFLLAEHTHALPIRDASQTGEARRLAVALAGRLGFDEAAAGKVALVVTEAGSNLLKHAGGGEILLQSLLPEEEGKAGSEAPAGLEILALDNGPGMADLERCFRDGFSTAGSPGTGLGAILRLADEVDVFSASQNGTAFLARLWAQKPAPSAPALLASVAPPPLEVGAVRVPSPGEAVCGDAWAVGHHPGRSVFLVTDGLGHGPNAAEASREAVRVFRQHSPLLGPGEILPRLHAALRSTRGAAVGVAEVRYQAQEVCFAGVGNIAASILVGEASRSAVSHNGILGHEIRKVQEFVYPFPREATLVMHSDGLATHWRLVHQYPGLSARTPALIAGVLYRDFKRGRDDVTVLVARWKK